MTATQAPPLMAVVLPPINEVIDLHSAHVAMARRHLPIPIMTVLMGAAAVGVGIIGFGNGRIGRRFSVLDAVYGLVLAAALWMIIDLDFVTVVDWHPLFAGLNRDAYEDTGIVVIPPRQPLQLEHVIHEVDFRVEQPEIGSRR